MEAVACERILALEELDPAHCRHDDDGAAHAAVGEQVQRRIELKPSLSVTSKRTAPQWHWPVQILLSSTMRPCLLFGHFYDIPCRITKPPQVAASNAPHLRAHRQLDDGRGGIGGDDLGYTDRGAVRWSMRGSSRTATRLAVRATRT